MLNRGLLKLGCVLILSMVVSNGGSEASAGTPTVLSATTTVLTTTAKEVKLDKPTELKAVHTDSNTVKIKWLDTTNSPKFKVYRSDTKTGGYTCIAVTKKASYTDKTAEDGNTYYYKVRGYYNDAGIKHHSTYSNPISITLTDEFTVEKRGNEEIAKEYAEQVLYYVNIERAKENLVPLALSTELQGLADIRAQESKELFSHSRPDGRSCFTLLDEHAVRYSYAGENIAYGFDTASSVVTAWMNSKGHRANIMNVGFAKLGVGVYIDERGVIYASQFFTD